MKEVAFHLLQVVGDVAPQDRKLGLLGPEMIRDIPQDDCDADDLTQRRPSPSLPTRRRSGLPIPEGCSASQLPVTRVPIIFISGVRALTIMMLPGRRSRATVLSVQCDLAVAVDT